MSFKNYQMSLEIEGRYWKLSRFKNHSLVVRLWEGLLKYTGMIYEILICCYNLCLSSSVFQKKE